MKAVWRNHGLSIFFGIIFLLALGGQSIAGLLVFNEEQTAHGQDPISWGSFVTSSAFVVDVAENWQSEYLQFFLFILATVWLVQKGSPESKKPGDEGVATDEEQLVGPFAKKDSPTWAKAEDWRQVLFSNSLLLVMGVIFVLSWLIQSIAGTVVYNDDQAQHGEPMVDWLGYVSTADFWNRTLQNWQSEFLAVGTMAIFSVWWRARGSAQSKPVGSAHDATGAEG